MTIAVLSNTTWSIYNFRRGLIKSLLANGFRVVAVAPPDQYEQRIRDLGAEFEPLRQLSAKGRNPASDLRLIAEIRAVIRKCGISAIFTYTPKGNIYGSIAARISGIRALPTINGLGYAFIQPGFTSKVLGGLYRLAFRGLPVVFVQNNDDARQLVRVGALSADQVQIVPGSGVNVSRFAPSVSTTAPAATPPQPLRFLMSARLVREKGVVEYLAAATKLVDDFPNAQFDLLGLPANNPSAVSRDEVLASCRHARINYLGHTDDINAAFDACDVFVLPSYYREGIPRVLLEALAKGKPIITTDSVGCREVVEHGQNGYLIEPRSLDSLVGACRKIIELDPDERAQMGSASRNLALLRFDERIVINIMLEYLQNTGSAYRNTQTAKPTSGQ